MKDKKLDKFEKLTIGICIGMLIIALILFNIQNSQWNINRECNKDISNCVCEGFKYCTNDTHKCFNNFLVDSNGCNITQIKNSNGGVCIFDLLNAPSPKIYYIGKCIKYRYKTEEELYCENNPDDNERCECKEWNEYYTPWGTNYNITMELMNDILLKHPYKRTNVDGVIVTTVLNLSVNFQYIEECIQAVPRESEK